MKKILRLILSIISVIIIVAIGVGIFLISPPSLSSTARTFVVSSGETPEIIANQLQADGIIRYSFVFRAWSKLTGKETKLQKGNYLIPAFFWLPAVHDLIANGHQQLVKVTIPDGFTLGQIAGLFEKQKITSKKSFFAAVSNTKLLQKYGIEAPNLEGFLFPDTYYFSNDYPADKVVSHLVDRFFQELSDIYPAWHELTPEELRGKVKLASIVEREYVVPEEAPLMSSVFINRLQDGMPLESCATIVYIITEIEGKPHPERVYYRDLEKVSPYNTYRNKGLPPGPISNPGVVALKAAFFPAKSDYKFFVLKSAVSGQHKFSRTFAEHTEASLLFLKHT